MKVRMLIPVSGGRGDGTWWPPPGVPFDVPDAEGAHLCAAGLAAPVAEVRKAETPEDGLQATEEKRTAAPKAARPRAAKPQG